MGMIRFLVALLPVRGLVILRRHLFVADIMTSGLRQPSLRPAHASRIKASQAPLGRAGLKRLHLHLLLLLRARAGSASPDRAFP